MRSTQWKTAYYSTWYLASSLVLRCSLSGSERSSYLADKTKLVTPSTSRCCRSIWIRPKADWIRPNVTRKRHSSNLLHPVSEVDQRDVCCYLLLMGLHCCLCSVLDVRSSSITLAPITVFADAKHRNGCSNSQCVKTRALWRKSSRCLF